MDRKHRRTAAGVLSFAANAGEESRERRSGRELVLTRIVEVLLIEALRATQGDSPPTRLARGLADPRVAIAIRQMHSVPSRRWPVVELAKKTALSRSTFFDRFAGAVGMAPMESRRLPNGVGYGSASAFSTAFSRHVGRTPSRYAKQLDAAVVS